MNPLETSGLPYNGPSFRCRSRVLFWGAIFAGAVAALALQILLMMLGAGLGFAIYNPVSNDNPVADFGAGAAVIQGLAAVVSLWAGGWIAGRFTGRAGLKVGALHGFMVWCLATATVIVAVSGGAGWALGGLSKIVGGGLSMAGQPAAAAVGGAADLAKEAAGRSQDMLKSFIDESVSNRRPDQNAGDTIRALFIEDVLVVAHPSLLHVVAVRTGAQPAMVRPPETLSTWPVIKPACSPAKNAMAPGRSSGTPILPSGMERRKASISFSGFPAPLR